MKNGSNWAYLLYNRICLPLKQRVHLCQFLIEMRFLELVKFFRLTTLTGEEGCTVRLVVAVKRKLQFYYWKNRKFLELQSDINLPDVPRTLAWKKDAICIGYGSAYSLIKMGWLNLQPISFRFILP